MVLCVETREEESLNMRNKYVARQQFFECDSQALLIWMTWENACVSYTCQA